ncbi:hypothetical protein IWQ60_012359 [Tieghemiomyces parasiticus]|uniref:Little elongation complex subunit 2 C-terminal domain-containing protein n=1 Tax=Tieghemiomyces parasiticus TaxID=78921 RepID=A0A9W7ZFF4_9FUNG|nr:hypothetical protein IWQ60_012359 [Tieghemiomyces parasiticus]
MVKSNGRLDKLRQATQRLTARTAKPTVQPPPLSNDPPFTLEREGPPTNPLSVAEVSTPEPVEAPISTDKPKLVKPALLRLSTPPPLTFLGGLPPCHSPTLPPPLTSPVDTDTTNPHLSSPSITPAHPSSASPARTPPPPVHTAKRRPKLSSLAARSAKVPRTDRWANDGGRCAGLIGDLLGRVRRITGPIPDLTFSQSLFESCVLPATSPVKPPGPSPSAPTRVVNLDSLEFMDSHSGSTPRPPQPPPPPTPAPVPPPIYSLAPFRQRPPLPAPVLTRADHEEYFRRQNARPTPGEVAAATGRGDAEALDRRIALEVQRYRAYLRDLALPRLCYLAPAVGTAMRDRLWAELVRVRALDPLVYADPPVASFPVAGPEVPPLVPWEYRQTLLQRGRCYRWRFPLPPGTEETDVPLSSPWGTNLSEGSADDRSALGPSRDRIPLVDPPPLACDPHLKDEVKPRVVPQVIVTDETLAALLALRYDPGRTEEIPLTVTAHGTGRSTLLVGDPWPAAQPSAHARNQTFYTAAVRVHLTDATQFFTNEDTETPADAGTVPADLDAALATVYRAGNLQYNLWQLGDRCLLVRSTYPGYVTGSDGKRQILPILTRLDYLRDEGPERLAAAERVRAWLACLLLGVDHFLLARVDVARGTIHQLQTRPRRELVADDAQNVHGGYLHYLFTQLGRLAPGRYLLQRPAHAGDVYIYRAYGANETGPRQDFIARFTAEPTVGPPRDGECSEVVAPGRGNRVPRSLPDPTYRLRCPNPYANLPPDPR